MVGTVTAVVPPVGDAVHTQVLEVKPGIDTFAKIKVIGVGGSGGSAVNRMVESNIRGVEFLAVNTDAQALRQNKATIKLHIGKGITRGLGAGMNPELGRKAAEESLEEIKQMLSGADMVFITCGLGGGTGTGASPVIADIAKEQGALTIAVVTKPFAFEGAQRRGISEQGHSDLAERVDAIVTIPNDRLLQIIDKKTSLLDAFGVADDVLKQGVQGISDLITMPGLINLDFADVKAIMEGAGSALMGIGRGSGENRAVDAAKAAIDSPLLEVSIDGAKGILFTVAGGKDLSMHEISDAAQIITKSSDPNARVIFGAIVDEKLGDEVVITVVATGFAGDDGYKGYKDNRLRERIGTINAGEPGLTDIKATGNRAPIKIKPLSTSMPATGPADDELEIPAFIRKRMMEEDSQ
ncbi:MAG: cell division protein FtsZ [Candidatus Jacksonbacteria bacterium RIFOXYC2_FULL_44_29]|nr:MAG: cell division protein FtsZ [Candidatus Jacksonbacteria bacterium RIFOXYA2_FULL_43_12]OGY76991.1 MAG: cell division protein FtsZ [Candidatus Jacksonbacteria bacterium RIFOXYB2_FULL_44_15]OGY77842.1 MAG: cell division protein FtsZ [Candidatus Jacksonbacteria bacterium RIFOXYC2_FULL_44_29]OGY80268.1 MAG: cell division protein FtsZ [Candidatus Jacksonbacteria bacterium RIFOXYD2_FULL_43_21]HBH46114.1 cell division protein FtsZ [Candidatus Jacksonbacteria bacterium]